MLSISLVRFGHKKPLGKGSESIVVWLKIPLLVAMLAAGDCPTSCEKPVLVEPKTAVNVCFTPLKSKPVLSPQRLV